MCNIVVVSMDKKLAISISEKIAKMLALTIIDADENLGVRLIGSLDFPIDLADDIMRNSENRMLLSFSEQNNCIISMSDELFLANENYKIFKKSLKIFVKIEKNEKIINSIQKLLEKRCDVTLQEKNINFDKLITLLRG